MPAPAPPTVAPPGVVVEPDRPPTVTVAPPGVSNVCLCEPWPVAARVDGAAVWPGRFKKLLNWLRLGCWYERLEFNVVRGEAVGRAVEGRVGPGRKLLAAG